jgi:hypothetical protein
MNSNARICIYAIVLFCLLGAFASCQANMQAANEPVFSNESVFKMASTPTFSSGTVDTSRTVANKTSIAIDPDDNYPAIAYYDSYNEELMYAKWDGSDWDDKTTVDSSGNVGQYASLAFDASGNPSIGYYDDTNEALKWAYDDDDDGDWDEGDWPMTLADNANDDFGKFCSHDISGNSFGFAFYKTNTTDLLYYEYNIVTSNTSQADVDSGNDVGQYCSLKFKSGVPGISYYGAYNGGVLKYATEGSPNWNVQTVDDPISPNDNVGQYSSLDYDGNGNASIAYYNATDRDYSWARWDSGMSRWYITSTAHDPGEDWGKYMSHKWYGTTKCGFAFQARDTDTNDTWLVFVLWGSGGGRYVADSTTDSGEYSSFAWVTAGGNDGDGWISHYDSTSGDLRYAFVND